MMMAPGALNEWRLPAYLRAGPLCVGRERVFFRRVLRLPLFAAVWAARIAHPQCKEAGMEMALRLT